MRQFFLCLSTFALGVAFGSTARYVGATQQAYYRGISAGLHACQSEAVKTGHGRWVAPGAPKPITFEWNKSLEDYRPDTRIKSPGAFLD